MKFALDSKLKMFVFGIIVLSLIFLGTSITVDLPTFVDKILEHYIFKIVFLTMLLVIGQKSLAFGIILAIIFILLSERIVNKKMETTPEINEEVEEVEST
jgi:uncharacterized protein YneF (UPF0154 family)